MSECRRLAEVESRQWAASAADDAGTMKNARSGGGVVIRRKEMTADAADAADGRTAIGVRRMIRIGVEILNGSVRLAYMQQGGREAEGAAKRNAKAARARGRISATRRRRKDC